MTNEELLAELARKVQAGELNVAEVLAHVNVAPAAAATPVSAATPVKHFSATRLLYIIGAVIVIIGVLAFVSQIWEDLGGPGHILVTLGLGFVLTGIGSALLKAKPGEGIGSVFHALGGMLLPGGAVVTLSELRVDANSTWPAAIAFGVLSIFYVLVNVIHKTIVLTFFTIGNATIFVYLFVSALLGSSFYNNGDIYAYLTMAVGASYLLLGYAFKDGWNSKLTPLLYAFGSAACMGAAFSRVFDSIPWQMFYFFVVAGGMCLAIYIRSRSILVLSTLFLIAHISYITSKYFADSVGWPICLVVLGFVFIGLGYASVNISKKYIAPQAGDPV